MWRFLSVVFSSSLTVFILGASQNMMSALAICIFQHLPRGLANVNVQKTIFDSYIKKYRSLNHKTCRNGNMSGY